LKKIVVFLIITSWIFGALYVPQIVHGQVTSPSLSALSYAKTIQLWEQLGYEPIDKTYPITLDTFVNDTHTLDTDDTNRLFLSWEASTLRSTVQIDEAGLYIINISYRSTTQSIKPIKLSISVNDSIPYEEASRIELPTLWSQEDDVLLDRFGNDVVPSSFQVYDMIHYSILDSVGLHAHPLYFYFEEGLNDIDFSLLDGSIELYEVNITSRVPLPSYENYLAQHHMMMPNQKTSVQGEDFFLKSDPSIRSGNHRDPKVTPFALMASKLNILDGRTFSKQNQSVYYQVEILESGLYPITFKVLQNTMIHTNVFRHISLNGQIPFSEAMHIKIPYSRDFQYITPSYEDAPLLFYFEKGIHVLGLHVDMTSTLLIQEGIRDVSVLMNQTTLNIQKITGNQIDKDRDWDLETYLPNLRDDLLYIQNTIQSLYDVWTSYHGTKTSPVSSVLKLSLSRMEAISRVPNDLPKRILEFSVGSGSVLALLGNILPLINEAPLSIDMLYIQHQLDALPPIRAGFFQRLWIGIQRFFLSFFSEQLDDSKDPETLEVWVNRGRAYVDLMQQMTDSLYTNETGQKVRISLMPDENKLILANAANAQPDVAMGIAAWRPFEFAVRNALYDLRQFDDFTVVANRFAPGAFLGLAYDEGIYALPETQNFQLLFYRKDVLNALDIPIPNTWNDVKNILPELQRFGMNFYMPLANNSSFKSFDTTFPFIEQFGGRLYEDDGLSVAFDDPKTLEALRLMTDFFKIFALPVEVGSFYQRFRYGNLPIGIGDFSMYVQLLHAAPEIAGLWDIALIPGVETDGVINRSFVGSSTVNVIFNASQKKDEAFDFLSWWSDTETQITYAERLLSSFGSAFLWNTANKDAFLGMSFDSKHQAIIYEQWSYVLDPIKVPGSYMVERSLSNIWNEVVYDGVTLRTSVEDHSMTANRELVRKMIEFGYITSNGQTIRSLNLPTLETLRLWGIYDED